ncbi:MAG: hypothetical protein WBD36_00535 [Bacteroidota bacterium]
MKLRILVFLVVAVSIISAQNQRPVKKNLFLYFDKVVAPPATSKEAHAKCFCDSNYAGTCSSDTLFNGLLHEVLQLQNEISMPPGTEQGELMKKMQDPEFQKKMQNMSQEEKMQMAMQMSQAMTPPAAMQPERPSVTAAFKAYSDLNQAEAESAQKLGEAVQKQMQEQQELEAKHNAVDTWQEEETKKLPEISTGESGGPDPKMVYKIHMNGWKKQLAIVDEQLKKSNKAWAEEKARLKKQFEPFEAALEKTHFGEDARNSVMKSSLGSGQVLMLSAVQKLTSASKAQYDDAAGWYEKMLAYQKQNEYLFQEK